MPLPETVQILAVISQELGTLGNAVALEGHTPTPNSKGYGNLGTVHGPRELCSSREGALRFAAGPDQRRASYADRRLRIPTTSMPR